MANELAYADEWADDARAAGADYNVARGIVQARATLNHPVYLGIVTAVVYDSKTDRYIVKFSEGSSAKATNDAAEFLLTHSFSIGMRPTVYAHMQDGAIDGVLLLFLSRES